MYVKVQSNRIKFVVCRARSRLRTDPQTDRQTDIQREHYSLCARVNINYTYYLFYTESICDPCEVRYDPGDNMTLPCTSHQTERSVARVCHDIYIVQ